MRNPTHLYVLILTVILIGILSMTSCKKEDSVAPVTAKTTPHITPVYHNTAVVIYTSHWDSTTMFYASNYKDPSSVNGLMLNSCEYSHVLAVGEFYDSNYGAAQGVPRGTLHTKQWKTIGSYNMTDTIRFAWLDTGGFKRQYYYSDVVKYCKCAGFPEGFNPWFCSSLVVHPNDTLFITNKYFNFTAIQ